MERLIVGTYRRKGSELADILQRGLNSGVTHIDTAISYGNYDNIIDFLRKDNHSPAITIKLGKRISTIDADLYEAFSVIKKAHTDWIHRVLLHHIVPPQIYVNIAESLNLYGCQIGVSNYNVAALDQLMKYLKENNKLNLKPVVNQIELHPFVRCLNIVEACKRYNIEVQGHSIFARGLGIKGYLQNETVEGYTKELGITYTVMLLAWALHYASTVCVSSNSEERWQEIVRNTETTLPEKIINALNELSEACGNKYRLYPFHRLRQSTSFELETNNTQSNDKPPLRSKSVAMYNMPPPEKATGTLQHDLQSTLKDDQPSHLATLFPNASILRNNKNWRIYALNVATLMFQQSLSDTRNDELAKRHAHLGLKKFRQLQEESLLSRLCKILNKIRHYLDESNKRTKKSENKIRP